MSGQSPAQYFSPVTDLTAAFTCHSLDTPRRRLSLDTDTSSGTPSDTPGRVSFFIGTATPESRHLEPLPEDASPGSDVTDKTGVCSREDAGSLSPRSHVEAMIVDPLISSNAAARISTVPLLVLPSSRGSSGSSGDGLRTPGVLISPSPSPVFDEDSRDSGYGGDAPHASGTSTVLHARGSFAQPRRPSIASDSSINVKESQHYNEEIDDDGIFEAMQMDEQLNRTDIGPSEPIAALLQQQIIFEGDKRAAVSTATESYNFTPLKRKLQGNRLTRCSADCPDAGARQDSAKRSTEENEDKFDFNWDIEKQPDFKRRKSFADSHFTTLRAPLKPLNLNRSHSETEAFAALHKDDTCHLIGDHSKPHALPIVDRPRVHDLMCISSDTLRRLMNGEFSHVVHGFTLVDCRYPYEYEGGHIMGAVHMYTQEQLSARLLNESVTTASDAAGNSKRHIYVFYCEFSRERGPKMTRYLRKCDRQLNEQHYPKLFYPELYLLDGGYKNFYATCSDLCEPRSYRSMHDQDHVGELRKFRSKSKSWCSGAGDVGDGSSVSSRRPGLNRGLFSSKGY